MRPLQLGLRVCPLWLHSDALVLTMQTEQHCRAPSLSIAILEFIIDSAAARNLFPCSPPLVSVFKGTKGMCYMNRPVLWPPSFCLFPFPTCGPRDERCQPKDKRSQKESSATTASILQIIRVQSKVLLPSYLATAVLQQNISDALFTCETQVHLDTSVKDMKNSHAWEK